MINVVTRRFIVLYPKSLLKVLSSSSSNKVIFNNLTSLKNARSKHSVNRKVLNISVPGSRYVPLSPLETAQEFISSTLNDKQNMTEEEWDILKSDLMENHDFISEENFSSIVMSNLLSSNKLDLSHAFLKYVEKSDVKPNFLTYLKYVSLCSKNRKTVDQEHILNVLQKVIKKIDSSPVLDLKCAEHVIQGLCATDRWREAFQYLDKLVGMKPSREMCNALACAALRNGDENLAWEILTKWINTYDEVSDSVVEEFLLVALKLQETNHFESDKLIKKLFQYMQQRHVVVSLDVAKLFEQYFLHHRLKWNITYTKVSRKGICDKCCHNLKLFEFSNSDFKELRDAFFERVVRKSDIFINTNRNEFEKYLRFIDASKPFHIVLDGLNAAYSYGSYGSRKTHSFQLLNIVKRMSGKTRKLLVLGRKHMRQWPHIEKISARAKLFFTDNISQDDPFVLYAALASGPHTLFLSGDLMRDHLSRLDDPRLMHLFKRWQLSHQVFVQSDANDSFKLIEPLRHSITIQGNMEDGWHIPFDDKIILDPYEVLNNWLCISRETP